MPFIRCPWQDIKKNYKKETSTTVIFSYVYKFGTETLYKMCNNVMVHTVWIIIFTKSYNKKFTRENGNKYLKFSYINQKKKKTRERPFP